MLTADHPFTQDRFLAGARNSQESLSVSLAPSGERAGVRGQSRQVSSDLLSISRSFHHRVPDFKPHRFKLATQLMIPEPQDFNSLFSEELVSFFVSRPFIWKTVTAPVQFDCQLCDRTVEIEKVDAARVLAIEFAFG